MRPDECRKCGVRHFPGPCPITIYRHTLPGVVEGKHTIAVGPLFLDTSGVSGTRPTAEKARDLAMAYLALAEHLDANPPVDEAQVEALTKILTEADMDGPEGPTPSLIARRLVQRGVRAEGGAS